MGELQMAEQRGEGERRARRKELLKSILRGLSVVLVPAAIIAAVGGVVANY